MNATIIIILLAVVGLAVGIYFIYKILVDHGNSCNPECKTGEVCQDGVCIKKSGPPPGPPPGSPCSSTNCASCTNKDSCTNVGCTFDDNKCFSPSPPPMYECKIKTDIYNEPQKVCTETTDKKGKPYEQCLDGCNPYNNLAKLGTKCNEDSDCKQDGWISNCNKTTKRCELSGCSPLPDNPHDSSCGQWKDKESCDKGNGTQSVTSSLGSDCNNTYPCYVYTEASQCNWIPADPAHGAAAYCTPKSRSGGGIPDYFNCAYKTNRGNGWVPN